jgi:hypothetical protein
MLQLNCLRGQLYSIPASNSVSRWSNLSLLRAPPQFRSDLNSVFGFTDSLQYLFKSV